MSYRIQAGVLPLIALLSAALRVDPVAAAEPVPGLCPVSSLSGIDEALLSGDSGEADDAPIILEAGNVEAEIGETPSARLSDGVLLRRGNRLAGADSAVYDPDTLAVELLGNVRYRDARNEVLSDSARFSYSTGSIRFRGAEFQLGQGGGRGAAGDIEVSREGTLELADVSYTTCPPGSNDWLLQADEIRLDSNTGVGSARNVALRFQGIPFLYAPRLSFPLGDARKTGFLTPEIGSARRSGNEIRVPFYWNIAENYDATITPWLLTDRGLQLGGEFRYLTQRNEGDLELEYLPNDDNFGDTRSFVQLRHKTLFDNGWRNLVDFSDASDGRYFEDLRGSLSAATITHLNRSFILDYYSQHWSLFARLQDYQTIDEAIAAEDDPYRRAPQIIFDATSPWQPLGLRAGLRTELVNFDRDVGVTGWRFDAQPSLAWGIEKAGWFAIPEVTLQHTRYELDNVAAGQIDDPSRTMPIASFDIGLNLERRSESSNWIQTLEPRMLYVHVPHREQANLPVFDTIVPDLNLVQLFRKNRFLGIDRIADADQLSLGVTSRIIDAANGEELMTATVGQIRYLSEQGVSLPDESFATANSDYVAEVRFLIYDNLNFDIGHQWGDRDRGTTKSEARIQYRPSERKILNFGYRFRRDSLEQGDVSWSWPVSERWNFVGRYNYSLRDDEVLEQFFGLEYESCCWGLRLVSRRYVSTREGTQDSAFGLQLVLKGMASVGTSADRILENGILGYTSQLE